MVTATERRWAELRARNLNLPGIDPGRPTLQRPELPLQKPCDFGLFGDSPAQIDLVDYISKQRG